MSLIELKWLASGLIAALTLCAGVASLLLSHHYPRLRRLGDAMAHGVFIGVAIFHLVPAALHNIHRSTISAYTIVFMIIVLSIFFLVVLTRFLEQFSTHHSKVTQAMILTLILSIHAFITGATLGIADTKTIASIVLIAILAHKVFETFALTVSLKRFLQRLGWIISTLIIFTCITPAGIFTGSYVHEHLSSASGMIATAYFNAIAAGTFLYIGSVHAQHKPDHVSFDTYHRYTQIIATFLGIAVMAVLSFWV